MVSSCRDLTLIEVKKGKVYFRAWGSCLFQNWLEVKATDGGEKPTQGLPEALFKWLITGNSDGLGTNQSRKVITDAIRTTEHSIFAAVFISLMLTHLQPYCEKKPFWTASQESHWASLQTQVHKLL